MLLFILSDVYEATLLGGEVLSKDVLEVDMDGEQGGITTPPTIGVGVVEEEEVLLLCCCCSELDELLWPELLLDSCTLAVAEAVRGRCICCCCW